VYEGYLVSATTQRQADQPHIIQLTFTLYTTRTSYLDKLRNQRADSVQTSYADSDTGDYIYYEPYVNLYEVRERRIVDLPITNFGNSPEGTDEIDPDTVATWRTENRGYRRQEISLSKAEDRIEIPAKTTPSAPSTSLGDVVSTLMTGAFVLGAAVEIAATAQEEIADLATTIRGVVADPAGAFINSAAVNAVTGGLVGKTASLVGSARRGELQLNKPTLSNPRILLTSSGTSGTFDGVLDI
jgi:hypothetical protein